MSSAWLARIGLLLFLLLNKTGHAQQHRATHLGNPATRFAPPLYTPQDLRERFADSKLRPDIASILRQWGWRGDIQDLYRAAATQQVTSVQLPVGTRMPFMSSRKNGNPVTLRDVLWAGREPIDAYAFTFSSKGRRYRCVTPKACSNFFLEDLGAPLLSVECRAPAQVPAGQPVEVCFALRNNGDAPEARTLVTVPIPDGALYIDPANERRKTAQSLKWEITNLRPGETKLLCAKFVMGKPGSMAFSSTAEGSSGHALQSRCATRITGIPAILLEVIDLEDPVPVGDEVTYLIKVVNQGSAVGSDVRVSCRLPSSQEFRSGSGSTPVRAEGGMVTMDPLPELASKAEATWRLVARAVREDDARFGVELSSNEFQEPIVEQESTRQY